MNKTQNVIHADEDERIIEIRLLSSELDEMELFINKTKLPDVDTMIRFAVESYMESWPWTGKCRWLEVCREMGVNL